MNWSSDPPRISGWWFMGESPDVLRLHARIVEVRRHRRKWQWSFGEGYAWNFMDEFPQYKWAGPIVPPSLENFNRAK